MDFRSVGDTAVLSNWCFVAPATQTRPKVWLQRLMCYMSGSSNRALCARNVHIIVYDVTTWSWVNL